MKPLAISRMRYLAVPTWDAVKGASHYTGETAETPPELDLCFPKQSFASSFTNNLAIVFSAHGLMKLRRLASPVASP